MKRRGSILVLALAACGGAAAPSVTPAPSSTSAAVASASASTAPSEDPSAAQYAAASAAAFASAPPAASSAPDRAQWTSLTLTEQCPRPAAREKTPPPPPCLRGRLGCGGGSAQHAPKIREMSCKAGGPLPADVMKRILRQNFGRVRLCYENALRRDPSIEGAIAVTVDIDATGAVTAASAAAAVGFKYGDPDVAAEATKCIGRAFGNLSFPDAGGASRIVMTYDLYVP